MTTGRKRIMSITNMPLIKVLTPLPKRISRYSYDELIFSEANTGK